MSMMGGVFMLEVCLKMTDFVSVSNRRPKIPEFLLCLTLNAVDVQSSSTETRDIVGFQSTIESGVDKSKD